MNSGRREIDDFIESRRIIQVVERERRPEKQKLHKANGEY